MTTFVLNAGAFAADPQRSLLQTLRQTGEVIMMTDNEIAEILGPVTRSQMNAALAAINGYGFDISAPWECDQDDREFEQFCGVLAAVTAAMSPADRGGAHD